MEFEFADCRTTRIWEYVFTRTTNDLPDPLFREVKSTAARQGIRLKDHVAQALRDKVGRHPGRVEKPWMKFAGIAAGDPEMVEEFKRIERVEEEDWK